MAIGANFNTNRNPQFEVQWRKKLYSVQAAHEDPAGWEAAVGPWGQLLSRLDSSALLHACLCSGQVWCGKIPFFVFQLSQGGALLFPVGRDSVLLVPSGSWVTWAGVPNPAL